MELTWATLEVDIDVRLGREQYMTYHSLGGKMFKPMHWYNKLKQISNG